MIDGPVPHIFLIAGEESGDRLGAALIAALRERTQGRVRFSAVGGEHIAEQGVPSLFPLGDLAIVGFTAIPPKLPLILRRIREAAEAVVMERPDVLVIIDSPDFTHRVARKVRKRAPGIPIVDYVCPSVWAWRPGRAKMMRAYVDHVLCLLPFEPAALKRLDGPPGTYVGHPLIERVDELRPNAAEAVRRTGEPPVLLVLPGSRSGEIRRLGAVFGAAAGMVGAKIGALEVVVPAVPRLADVVGAAVRNWPVAARVVVEPAEKLSAFRIARAALSKSGTSTLELALAGVPMVTAYKVSVPEAVAARLLVMVESVILANLVMGERIVPEFLQWDCTPERLAAAVLPLLSDTPERRRQVDGFRRLDTAMAVGKGPPSSHAAAVVLGHLRLNHS
ncbi:MAG TPA: lipid-A-disaccharide synthase [Pseudolabrys sp.]|nr:lipid-A-disaccharide synthase [Pseudolabrys sp.]